MSGQGFRRLSLRSELSIEETYIQGERCFSLARRVTNRMSNFDEFRSDPLENKENISGSSDTCSGSSANDEGDNNSGESYGNDSTGDVTDFGSDDGPDDDGGEEAIEEEEDADHDVSSSNGGNREGAIRA